MDDRCENILSLKRLQYKLPSEIGDKFVQVLAEEILLLANGEKTSNPVIFFIALILQRERKLSNKQEIRREIRILINKILN